MLSIRAVRKSASHVPRVRFNSTAAPIKVAPKPVVKTIKSDVKPITATTSTVARPVAAVAPKTYSYSGATSPAKPQITVNRTLDQVLGGKTIDNEVFPSKSPDNQINWTSSYLGLGTASFDQRVNDILLAPLEADEIEITPDGLLYLPEIKYRRTLNKAFGPGGWGLAPRTPTLVTPKCVTREYALICQGRLVSVARGEQDYFGDQGIPTATEGCKSNALMRCCKDLGIASELWDPSFIRKFKKLHCEDKFLEHVVTKKKKRIWKRKDATFEYPYKA